VPFREILSTLIAEHAPTARAAIFCDDDGEKVDAYALEGIDSFDVDLMGAAYARVAATVPLGSCVRVAHPEKTVWLAPIDCGYYLVVLCAVPSARGVDGAMRADLPRAVAALAAHM
jgi:hypothetical protein